LDQAKKTTAELEKHLSAAECGNVALRTKLSTAESQNARKTVAIRLCTQAADELARRLATSESSLDATREQLREQTKSFCTHCGKLFPKGKEGLEQFREHIAECNARPLHKMAVDNATLRGLLREAVECEEHGVFMEQRWFDEARAALEGKP